MISPHSYPVCCIRYRHRPQKSPVPAVQIDPFLRFFFRVGSDQFSAAAEQALSSFLTMRQTEGERLAADLSGKLDGLEAMLGKVEAIEPSVAENYRSRLYAKIKEILADQNIDEQRILTETAIFAEKTAIDEETDRLHSHLAQLRTLLASAEPVGRKLDFLVQVMNREINTIGYKAQDLGITRL
jgi:uncharacterized protein (TIGR00255 family)